MADDRSQKPVPPDFGFDEVIKAADEALWRGRDALQRSANVEREFNRELGAARSSTDDTLRLLGEINAMPGSAKALEVSKLAAKAQADATRELGLTLQKAIAQYSADTAETSAAITRWTKAQAVASWSLVFLTAVLAFFTASQVFGWFEPR